MVEVTQELIYELLKRMQADIGLLRDGMREVKTRLTSLETQVALLRGDFATPSGRVDRLELRVERIERRLDLVEEKS